MLVADVIPKIACGLAGEGAVATLERFFLRVDEHVLSESSVAGADVITPLALQQHICMGLLMVLELLSAVAQKLTLGTAELGTLVVVESHVYRQVGLDGTSVVTSSTLVRFDASVEPLVAPQVRAGLKGSRAVLHHTLEGSVSCMCP